MCGGIHHPNTRRSLWHSGEANRHRKDTLFKQAFAEFLCKSCFTQNDWQNWSLGITSIETEFLHLRLQECGITPQFLHEFIAIFEHIDSFETRRNIGYGHCAAEQKRTTTLLNP